MVFRAVLTQNWYSRPRRRHQAALTFFFLALVWALSFAHWNGLDMAVSGAAVFGRGEWWRLWSALFVHGDLSHLLSNSLLFTLFAWLLIGHFGLRLALLAFLLGGLTNFLVIPTLPPATTLVGVSGVVYWMGASWLTLFLLVDRRQSWRVRFGSSLFLGLMLFVPETWEPHVSYLNHFVGFVSGVLAAVAFYLLRRKAFRNAERWEWEALEEPDFDWGEGTITSP